MNDSSMTNFLKCISAVFISSFFITLIFSSTIKNPDYQEIVNTDQSVKIGSNDTIYNTKKPILEVKSDIVDIHDTSFNIMNYVKATIDGTDISDHIKTYGSVDIQNKGQYDVTFVLQYKEITLRKEATYIVE